MPRSGISVIIAITLIAGSTLERTTIGFGGYSFFLSHLLAFFLMPILLIAFRAYHSEISRTVILLVLAGMCSLPAVLSYGSGSRTGYLLQLAANSLLFLVALILLAQLSLDGIRTVVRSTVALLLIGAILQVFLFPELSDPSGVRFAGVPRPSILFAEPTWLAIFAAMLFAAAVALRMRICSVLLALLVLGIFTRSALVLVASVAVMSICSPKYRRAAFTVLFATVGVFASWFVYSSLVAENRVAQISSLDTRQLDIFAIRMANAGQLSVLGSPILEVFDSFRNRVIPTTSNVLSFDLYWKFGLGGLLIFLGWFWLMSWFLPRLMGADFSRVTSIGPWTVLALIPLVMQINNAFGRPWLWVMCALLLAVISKRGNGEEGLANELDVRSPIRKKMKVDVC